MIHVNCKRRRLPHKSASKKIRCYIINIPNHFQKFVVHVCWIELYIFWKWVSIVSTIKECFLIYNIYASLFILIKMSLIILKLNGMLLLYLTWSTEAGLKTCSWRYFMSTTWVSIYGFSTQLVKVLKCYLRTNPLSMFEIKMTSTKN
jgi:hypothetical protein